MAVEFLRQQQEVSEAVELPASEVALESGAMPESEAADRAPQVSRYSGSLFRQPRLLTSCPKSWVGRSCAEHDTKTRNSNTYSTACQRAISTSRPLNQLPLLL